jgi:hypothetical protein
VYNTLLPWRKPPDFLRRYGWKPVTGKTLLLTARMVMPMFTVA